MTATDAAGEALGSSSYTYDAAGNMTGRALAGGPQQSLTWDTEGELAGVSADSDGDGQVQEAESDRYVYSADGDRLVRRQGGLTTVYLPGQELTVSGLGVVSAKRYYSFAGQTVAVRTGNTFDSVSSIFSDAHGTGVLQVANVANTVTRRLLDPFGAERDATVGVPRGSGGVSSWVGDRGFLDKPTDGTGLTQIGARYYDPGLGAFVSVDPLMDLADPAQWNAYGYANNNPTTLSDPSGLIPIGAGHTGYNPRQKNDPRKYDRCSHAISCEKTVKGAGGRPVKVRVNYTDTAAKYFSKPAHRTTKIQHNVAHSQDRARAKAKAAHAAKKRAAAAEQRRVEQEKEDQQQSLIGRAWDGIRDWAGSESGSSVSTVLGWISIGAGALSFVPGIGLAAGIVSVAAGAASAGIDCLGGGFDGSCAVGILGASVGSIGYVARGISRFFQATPADEILNADIASFGLSAPLGLAGLGMSAIDGRRDIPGW